MKIYKISGGILKVGVISKTSDYVNIKTKFNEEEVKLKCLTTDDFISLDKWVKTNYTIIK